MADLKSMFYIPEEREEIKKLAEQVLSGFYGADKVAAMHLMQLAQAFAEIEHKESK